MTFEGSALISGCPSKSSCAVRYLKQMPNLSVQTHENITSIYEVTDGRVIAGVSVT